MLIGLVLVIVKLVAKLAWHNWPVTLIVVAAVVGLVVWRRLRHGEQNETVVNDSSE
jgi:carbon starvation protein CstA